MYEDVAKEWIKELRSGNYKQGRGTLRNAKNECCCLGVLCDLMEGTEWTYDEPFGRYYIGASTAIVPPHIAKWAGMKFSNGNYRGDDNYSTSLVFANDTGRKSFKEIADIIEKHWKEM